MKTRTLLIAAVMLVALSAAAFGQAIWSVSSIPVTAVIATGNAELPGNIMFTPNNGSPNTVAGTIQIVYGGTNVNITSPWSAIYICTNATAVNGVLVANTVQSACVGTNPTMPGTIAALMVDLAQSVYSPGTLVIDVPVNLTVGVGGVPAQFMVVGVRTQISGTGLTSMTASISSYGNEMIAGETNPTVINSIQNGIASVTSYTSTPPLTSASTTGAPSVAPQTGILSGANTTISIKEGFGAAFTKGVGVRITVSARPPAGVSFTFPATATSYDVLGNVVNPNWVLGNSTSTTVAGVSSITSSSTTASSLQVYYYVGTDTAADAVNLEYLEIPVLVASAPGSETLPLSAASITYTVTLAPQQGPWGTGSAPPPVIAGLLAPRFADLEVPTTPAAPATLLTIGPVSATNILLMPYVTVGGGFDTGIAIANTTEDPGTTVLGFTGAVPQSGPITFYFYSQNNGTAAFSYVTSSTSPGSGLVTGTGNVQSGGTYVALLSQLLAAAGQPATFAGYIIAVTNFSDAYGIYTVSNFTTLAAYSTVMPFITVR